MYPKNVKVEIISFKICQALRWEPISGTIPVDPHIVTVSIMQFIAPLNLRRNA